MHVKNVIASSSVLLMVLLFSGCSEKQQNNLQNNKTSNKVSTVPLRWLAHWHGEGKKEVMIRELAREFSLLNEDIELDLKFPQDVYTYTDESQLFGISFEEIAKMARNNEWPFDVLLCDQERYKKVGDLLSDPNWGEKYLVDFSQEPWFQAAHKDGLIEDGKYKERYGGIMPGPLLEGIANILYVSEEVEKLLGIQVKRYDMQMSDFIEYAQAVYNYNQSHQDKITCYSTQYNLALSAFLSQLVQSEYGKENYTSKKEAIAALTEVLQAMEKAAQYKPIEQFTTFSGMQYDAAQRVLKQEKFLFNIQPSWMYLLWNNTNPDGTKLMKPCELPSMNNKTSPSYSGFFQAIFVVPKNAKNVEQAKRLIKFISTSEVAEKWIKYAKCPTGLKTQIAYSDFGQEEFEKYYRHLQKKYGNNQKSVDLSKLLFNSNTAIDFKVEDVLMGRISANEAIRSIEKQVR